MEHIYLIGFMGSGKSANGVKLSYLCRRTLTDTDALIEKKAKKSISEIFAQDGEAAFREKETEVLRELVKENTPHIFAVGGGTPMREENRALLQALGTVVFLRASAETVYERVKNDTSRPLLQGGDPLDKIRRLLAERTPVYEALADVVVDVDGKEVAEVAEEILRRVRKRSI